MIRSKSIPLTENLTIEEFTKLLEQACAASEKEKLEKLEKEREQRMHGVVDEKARDTGDIQDDAVIVGAWSGSEA